MEIKSMTDVRSASALLTANINNMCNSKDTDTIVKNFVEAKELLVAIFKYNVEINHK